jgi:hypothetical protein
VAGKVTLFDVRLSQCSLGLVALTCRLPLTVILRRVRGSECSRVQPVSGVLARRSASEPMTFSPCGCEKEITRTAAGNSPITRDACGPDHDVCVAPLCRLYSDEDATEEGEIHDEDGEIEEEFEESSVIDVDSCSVEFVDTGQSSQASDDISAHNQDFMDANLADPSLQHFLPSPERDCKDVGDSQDQRVSNCENPTSVTNHMRNSEFPDRPSLGLHLDSGFPSPDPDSPAIALAEEHKSSLHGDVLLHSLTRIPGPVHRSFPLVHPAMSYMMHGTPPPLPPPPHFLSLPPHIIPGFPHHLHSFPPRLDNEGRNQHFASGSMQVQPSQLILNARHGHGMQHQADFAPSRLSPPLSPPCHQVPSSAINTHDSTSRARPAMTVGDGKTSSRNCELTTHHEGAAWTRPDAETNAVATGNGTRYRTCDSPVDDINDKRSIQNPVTPHSRKASALKRKASALRDTCPTRGGGNERLSKFLDVPGSILDVPPSSPSASERHDTPSSKETPDAKVPITPAPRRRIDLTAMKAAVLMTLRKQSCQDPIPSAQRPSSKHNDVVVFSCDEEDKESEDDSESDGSMSGKDCYSPTLLRHDSRKVDEDAKSCEFMPMVLSPAVSAPRDTQALKRRELEDLRKRVKQKEEDLAIKALQYGTAVSNCPQNCVPLVSPISKELQQASQGVDELPSNAKELILREKQDLARRIAELESMRRKTCVESEQNLVDHSKSAKAYKVPLQYLSLIDLLLTSWFSLFAFV